ncbi:hypothetical protein NEPAR08_1996 [Nematocida parisii]|nr:hypothetical protein NEPAR03_1945 [Nematocida parisii]KAI5130394.1 hypothetical protein NEPAR08_1996 [Nematocida parisii]
MFRFDLPHLYRRLTEITIKRIITNRVNNWLEGKITRRLTTDQITFDIIRGIVIIEGLGLNRGYVSSIIGVKVAEARIDRIIFMSNWYNTDLFTDVKISGVEIAVGGVECICKISDRCYACRKTSTPENKGIIMRVLNSVLGSIAERVTARMKVKLEKVKVSVRLETLLSVEIKQMDLIKENEKYKVKLEKENISISGIKTASITIEVTTKDDILSIQISSSTINIYSREVSVSDLVQLVSIIKYAMGEDKENIKYENNSRVGTTKKTEKYIEKSPVVKIDISTDLRVCDIKEIDQCVLSCKNLKIGVYEKGVIRVFGTFLLRESTTEIITCKRVNILLNDSSDFGVFGRKVRIYIKSINLNIHERIIMGLFNLYKKLFNLYGKEEGKKEEKSELSMLIVIDRINIKTSIGNSVIEAIGTKTSVSIEEGVVFYSNSSITVANSLVNTAIPYMKSSISVTGMYKKELKLDLVNVDVPESVTSAVILLILAVRDINKYISMNKDLFVLPEREKAQNVQDMNKNPILLISECKLTGVHKDTPCIVSAHDTVLCTDNILVDRLELVYGESSILSVRPVQILMHEVIEIIFTNTEVLVPCDDILNSIMMDIRTVYMAVGIDKKAERNGHKVNIPMIEENAEGLSTPEHILSVDANLSVEHISEGVIPKQEYKGAHMVITLRNTTVQINNAGTVATVYSSDISISIAEIIQVKALSADVHYKNGLLKAVGHKLVYNPDEKRVIGSFTCEGSLDVDLYVLLVNRIFFILDGYTIIMDSPIYGVPTIPGLNDLIDPEMEEEESDNRDLVVNVDVSTGITVLKDTYVLCKTVAQLHAHVIKDQLYHGVITITNIKGWSDGLLICSAPEVTVNFAKISRLIKSASIVIEKAEIADTIGLFLDMFGLFTKVNFNNGVPTVPTMIDIKCKVSHLILRTDQALITISKFAMINSYMQLALAVSLNEKQILKDPLNIKVRLCAHEMPEMHISIDPIESKVIEKSDIEGMLNVYNRLNQARIQKYPIPANSTIRIECGLISMSVQQPPIKTEVVQLTLAIIQLESKCSVDMNGSAMCRVFVSIPETQEYEIMCETFPINISMQTQINVEKENTGFCSLPFAEEKKEESLLVAFLSLVAKDTIRIRLSKRIVEALKRTKKTVHLTNLTNQSIIVNDVSISPLTSTVIESQRMHILTDKNDILFKQHTPGYKEATQMSNKLYMGTFKEETAVIRGGTNFKNITDTPIFIRVGEEKILVPPFSECSHTSVLTEFTAAIENSQESSASVLFDIPERRDYSKQIHVIGLQRIVHGESYITVACLFEVVSNLPILHYLFHHEFILRNLTLATVGFEIKISAKSKTEKILATAQSGEIKQISGNREIEKVKKIRLKINSNADLFLFPYESSSKVTVSKGIIAAKEAKTVLVSGCPVDIGIIQVTIYPVLIAINKTQDDLHLKSGSTLCAIPYDQQVTVITSRDKHSIVFNKCESKAFSSKIQYNTVFLDIKSTYQMNYLMNIYQGEGSKEKIKYVVVEYANVIENKTGLDLTIVTDREFTCGTGERVPMHFPRKKFSSWIRLGSPRDDFKFESGSPAQEASSDMTDYILDLEKSVDASYLPLEGLKKHFVKLNTASKGINSAGMLSSAITSRSSIYLNKSTSSFSMNTVLEQPAEADEGEEAFCVNNSILLSITIQTNNSQRVILIEKEDTWPYLIKNMSQKKMQFSQKGYPIEYILKPNEVLPYYWDSFKAQPAFNVEIDGQTLKISDFSVVTAGGFKATLTSERQIKVLTVTEQTQDISTDASTTQGTLIRARTGRVSVSLMDREEIEFAAVHLFNIQLVSLFSPNGLEFLFKMDSFQMDNQETKGYYHIPMHTPITSDVLSVSGWIVNQNVIRYMSIVILPVVLEIEEVYMKRVIEHFVPLAEPIENPKYFIMCSVCRSLNCTCTYVDHTTTRSVYMALGYFKIEAVKFKCSFRRAPHGSIVPLSSVFCNITSSKVSLPSIELFDIYARTYEVYHIIGRMYKRGFIRNIVSLVLSADVVASPGELFDKLGVGVHDLIYSPYRALDNPALLSKQLLKGGKSLATNVVTGVAGFVGNVMGKFSQKLADISMDENFAEAIRETSCIYIDELDMGLPGHKTHLSKAGEKFMGSVISGFKGVVHSPMQGRRSNGISGMVQGVGKGLLGAIIKPISGAVGLMQGISTSITGVLGNDKPLLRIQLPRAPPLDNVPVEYEVERNSYYRAYVVLIRNDSTKRDERFITGGICTMEYIGWFVLITNMRVILYNKEEVQEIPGIVTAQEKEKHTVITVDTIEIYLEGLRVFREIGKYSSLMIVRPIKDHS